MLRIWYETWSGVNRTLSPNDGVRPPEQGQPGELRGVDGLGIAAAFDLGYDSSHLRPRFLTKIRRLLQRKGYSVFPVDLANHWWLTRARPQISSGIGPWLRSKES